jgi:hypothetical protein
MAAFGIPDRSRLRTGRRERGAIRLPLVVLVLAAVVALVLAILWRGPNAPLGALPRTGGDTNERLDSLARAPSDEPTRTDAGPADEATPSSHEARRRRSRLVEIRGRFVDARGLPVEGVSLHLNVCPSGPYDPPSLEPGPSESGGLEHSSDPNGRFSLSFEPRAGAIYCMSAGTEGTHTLQWRWTELEPGNRHDLGEIEWLGTGSILGRLLDERGQPLRGQAWKVKSIHPRASNEHAQWPNESTCVSEADSGAFHLEHVPEGRCRLQIELGSSGSFTSPVLEVLANQTTHADIVCPIGDWTTTIGVLPTCAPFGEVSRQVESVHARLGDTTLVASRPTNPKGCFTFEGVAPGDHTIWIEDDKFLPWSADGVRGGALVEATLKGNARVRLSVQDAESRAPLERYSVHVRLNEDGWHSKPPVRILGEEEVAPDGGAIDGLLPIQQTLVVSCEGYAEASVDDIDLLPGETRAIEVLMTRGSTVSGVVVQEYRSEDSAPVLVRLVPRGSAGNRELELLDSEKGAGTRLTRADFVSGRFSFEHVVRGKYLVQAARSLTVHSAIEEVEVKDGEPAAELELHLPSEATLKGRVLAPSGTDLQSMHLYMLPEDFVGEVNGFVPSQAWQRRLRVPIDADGQYATGPLPPGTLRVQLGRPDTHLPNGYGVGRRSTMAKKVDLGQVVLEPGVENVQDFDISEYAPGSVRIRANLQGGTATDVVVDVCRILSSNTRRFDTEGGALLDADGSALVGLLLPGSYLVMVRELDRNWYWLAPIRVEVASGQETHFECDIQLVRARVVVGWLGAGADVPRGELRVQQEFGELVTRPVTVVPDTEGAVELELPRGRYLVRFYADGSSTPTADAVRIDWPVPEAAEGRVLVPR